MISTSRVLSRLKFLARIQIGRIEATTGRNFVEMKKKSTSRHAWTGLTARAYAAGIASARTMTVERTTITAELANASPNDSRPAALLVTSWYRSSVGWKKSLGLVFASCSLLNELSTIQKTGKKKIRPVIQATSPNEKFTQRRSPTTRGDGTELMRSPHLSANRTGRATRSWR